MGPLYFRGVRDLNGFRINVQRGGSPCLSPIHNIDVFHSYRESKCNIHAISHRITATKRRSTDRPRRLIEMESD